MSDWTALSSPYRAGAYAHGGVDRRGGGARGESALHGELPLFDAAVQSDESRFFAPSEEDFVDARWSADAPALHQTSLVGIDFTGMTLPAGWLYRANHTGSPVLLGRDRLTTVDCRGLDLRGSTDLALRFQGRGMGNKERCDYRYDSLNGAKAACEKALQTAEEAAAQNADQASTPLEGAAVVPGSGRGVKACV